MLIFFQIGKSHGIWLKCVIIQGIYLQHREILEVLKIKGRAKVIGVAFVANFGVRLLQQAGLHV